MIGTVLTTFLLLWERLWQKATLAFILTIQPLSFSSIDYSTALFLTQKVRHIGKTLLEIFLCLCRSLGMPTHLPSQWMQNATIHISHLLRILPLSISFCLPSLRLCLCLGSYPPPMIFSGFSRMEKKLSVSPLRVFWEVVLALPGLHILVSVEYTYRKYPSLSFHTLYLNTMIWLSLHWSPTAHAVPNLQ